MGGEAGILAASASCQGRRPCDARNESDLAAERICSGDAFRSLGIADGATGDAGIAGAGISLAT